MGEAKDPTLKEKCFKWVQLFSDLDDRDGHSLDEHKAHRFWEAIGESYTVIAMREKLREVDLDSDKMMSFLEFALSKNDADHFSESCYNVTECLTRSQGSNEDLDKAMASVQKLMAIANAAKEKEERIKADIVKYEGKVVKQNRAKNELEQHNSRDDTDFNRAILSAEAAVRKAKRNTNLVAQGSNWWVGREIEEAKKYLPKGDLQSRN